MGKKIKFINNNSLEEYRFKSLFSKEPETIYWIKKIKRNEILIDIGSNIGIYSLFAGKKNKNSSGSSSSSKKKKKRKNG